ncbi:MAG TPA: hypothetical protein VMW24_22255 [Sedimentisphaerales bacterium]|nr:hypothetical protein [Sedimentisphaerales bacterium]
MAGERYSDPMYEAAIESQIPNVSGTATATASAAVVTKTDATKFELFARCKLLAMKAQVLTAEALAPAGAGKLLLMNGATQLGDVAIGTSTALTDVDGTMTAAACADIAANTELQVDMELGTATASAGVHALGPVNLRLTYQRLFA